MDDLDDGALVVIDQSLYRILGGKAVPIEQDESLPGLVVGPHRGVPLDRFEDFLNDVPRGTEDV